MSGQYATAIFSSRTFSPGDWADSVTCAAGGTAYNPGTKRQGTNRMGFFEGYLPAAVPPVKRPGHSWFNSIPLFSLLKSEGLVRLVVPPRKADGWMSASAQLCLKMPHSTDCQPWVSPSMIFLPKGDTNTEKPHPHCNPKIHSAGTEEKPS